MPGTLFYKDQGLARAATKPTSGKQVKENSSGGGSRVTERKGERDGTSEQRLEEGVALEGQS